MNRLETKTIRKSTVLAAIILISFVTLGTTQFTSAQSTPDWTLTVHVVGVPFGDSTLHVEVQGPFGSHLYDNIRNSQYPSTSFNMPGDQYPTDYYYRICVSSNIVGLFLPHCSRNVHGQGDESVRVRP
jgi:hypothetical protein